MDSAEQVLLKLVSRAHTIIAQIYKVSNQVPEKFKYPSAVDAKNLLIDFEYYENPSVYDEQRDMSQELIRKDEANRKLHLDIVKEVVDAFQAMHKYGIHLNSFLKDLDDGLFLQQSIDSLLQNQSDSEGKQLLIEALFLYGVMLLVMDSRIEGRERIIVAYSRWTLNRVSLELRELFKEVNPAEKYPECLFSRVKVFPGFAAKCLARLKTDDVFNQFINYPLPEHRSLALSTQASMIYVILYFMPNVLTDDYGSMREIVDRHFNDNWVISYYLGRHVDLSLVWNVYPAAKAAMQNTIFPSRLKKQVQSVESEFYALREKIASYLTEGTLTEEYFLNESNAIMDTIRGANHVLRFLFLHTLGSVSRRPELNPLLDMKNKGIIVSMLFDLAQLELVVKGLVKTIVENRSERWKKFQSDVVERLMELADYFGGKKVLTNVEKSEQLETWFRDLCEKVKLADDENLLASGRILVQIIKALEQVQYYRQFDSYLHMKVFLNATTKILYNMIRLLNINDSFLLTLNQITEFVYAWEIMPDCVQIMQTIIKEKPKSIQNMRATFLKMASSLDLPLVRMNDAKSDEIIRVSQYYSFELVQYVQKVLQIIPRTLFNLVDDAVKIYTNDLLELPSRLEKPKLLGYIQFDTRLELSKIMFQVCTFTEGLLAMESTLVGIMEINPREILIAGLRKELSNRLFTLLETGFKTQRDSSLKDRILNATSNLTGFQRTFSAMHDFLHVDALKLWREEYSKIVDKALGEAISGKDTFMLRLSEDLISLSDPKKYLFSFHNQCWIDLKNNAVVLNERLIELLSSCIGVSGLRALIRLFESKVKSSLQNAVDGLFSSAKDDNMKEFLFDISAKLVPFEVIPGEFGKIYPLIMNGFPGFAPKGVFEDLASVGQLLQICIMLRRTLLSNAHMESPDSTSSLTNYHDAAVTGVYKKCHSVSKKNTETVKIAWPGSLDTNIGFQLRQECSSVGFEDALFRAVKFPDDLGEVLPGRWSILMFSLLFSEISRSEYISSHNTFATTIGFTRKYFRDVGMFLQGWLMLSSQIESEEKVMENTLNFSSQFTRTWFNSVNSKSGNMNTNFMNLDKDLPFYMEKAVERLCNLDSRVNALKEVRLR